MLIGVMIKRQGTLGIFKTVKLKLDPSVFAPFPFITFSLSLAAITFLYDVW